MHLSFAKFNFTRRNKSYCVEYDIQNVYRNVTYASAKVMTTDEHGRLMILADYAVSGRQVVSPSRAKKLISKTLKNDFNS
jgi:hypothetical protein